MFPTRRHLLQAGASLPWLLTPVRGWALSPTPACDDGASATAAQMAGPFARDTVALRHNLREPDMAGVPLRLRGMVQDVNCRALKGCTLSFWQADPDGRYDPDGGRLYGRQVSADGRYQLDTVVPGRYPGRVRHLHVTLHDAEGQHRLTTQLYFPDDPGNRDDFLFDPALLMAYQQGEHEAEARFDFVLA